MDRSIGHFAPLEERLMSAAGTLPDAPMAMPEQDLSTPITFSVRGWLRALPLLPSRAGQ